MLAVRAVVGRVRLTLGLRFQKAFEIPQPEFLTHHPRRASASGGDHARSSDECFWKAVSSLGGFS